MSISLVLISYTESEFILVGHSQYGDTSMRTSGWTHARASMFPCTMFPALVRYACPRGARVARTTPAPPDHAQGPLTPLPFLTRIATCEIPHLLLQHPDKTLATNV